MPSCQHYLKNTSWCPQASFSGSRMELHLPHKKETTTPYHHGLSQLRMRGIWGNVCHHPNVEPLLYILYGHIFATKPVDGHLHWTFYFLFNSNEDHIPLSFEWTPLQLHWKFLFMKIIQGSSLKSFFQLEQYAKRHCYTKYHIQCHLLVRVAQCYILLLLM